MKSLKIKNFTILVIFLFIFIIIYSCTKVSHYELSRFISPEKCGECHDSIYNQWKESMHNLAHNDPLYKEVALHDLKGLTDKDEIEEAELCVKCHTPIGFVTGLPTKTSEHVKQIPEIPQKGVQCDFCHSTTGAYKLYNASLKLDPGHGEDNPGTKRGPFKDSKSDYHKSAFSEFHTTSEICATCHDVHHVVFGTKLETPYEEWAKGPYNSSDEKKRITCQGCHMYQRPGIPATGSTERPKNPGLASSDGPQREHVFTHYFVGANTIIPTLYKNKVQPKMAEERLKNAATLKIDPKIKNGLLSIIIKNIGAGHNIPTGLAHVRQVWLEIVVKDSKGNIIFSSGTMDKNGYLNADIIIFNTVFGDEKGNLTMNVAKARKILKDNRIAPLQEVTEKVKLPIIKDKQISVEAKLLYRLASQKLVDDVLGKNKLKLPVIEMASDKKIIKI